MTPEELTQLKKDFEDLKTEHETLKKEFEAHKHTGLDSQLITARAFIGAPFTFIADPTAGATQDAEARLAINSILDILEKSHLMFDQ